jgi:Fe-S-cluster containining protein
MSDSPRDPENRVPAPSVEDSDATQRCRRFELRSVVVRYEERPDRCTIYPRRESCCEQIEAWLSADADAFVALDEMR